MRPSALPRSAAALVRGALGSSPSTCSTSCAVLKALSKPLPGRLPEQSLCTLAAAPAPLALQAKAKRSLSPLFVRSGLGCGASWECLGQKGSRDPRSAQRRLLFRCGGFDSRGLCAWRLPPTTHGAQTSSLWQRRSFGSSAPPPSSEDKSSQRSSNKTRPAKKTAGFTTCVRGGRSASFARRLLKSAAVAAWQMFLKALRFAARGTVVFARGAVAFVKDPRVAVSWAKSCKEACLHTWYWCSTGFRLFFANLRVSHQLLKKKILGYPLRYNEHKLLVRTTADALKLIPFSLLIIIPLGELLIPVALRLFPNMLPSTFIAKKTDNAYLSRKLQAKQELAAFFQELLQEHTRNLIEQTPAADAAAKARALKSFQKELLRPRTAETPLPDLEDILAFSRMFKDEFVLSKMDTQTLQVVCKLLGLQPYSIRSHLVLQLRHHINHIQREDRELLWEGVDALSHEELVEACRDRGMRFYGTSDDSMREQLRRWLEVSSHKDVPPIVLLWSRCVSILPTSSLQTPSGGAAPAASSSGEGESLQTETLAGAAEASPSSIAFAAVADSAKSGAAQIQVEEAEPDARPEATDATSKNTQEASAAAAEAEEAARKAATLEAMTRQVEMLREEEDGLRRSISLLQEERAQQLQRQEAEGDSAEALSVQQTEEESLSQTHTGVLSDPLEAGASPSAVVAEASAQATDAAASAEAASREGRDARIAEKELKLLRRLTDLQHEQHERQFRGFNGLQLAFDALQRKLSDAASPAGQEEEVPSEAAADSEKKTLPSAAEEADAQALRRAAELLSPELHELSVRVALLAQEFADDVQEVEILIEEAKEPADTEVPTTEGEADAEDGVFAESSSTKKEEETRDVVSPPSETQTAPPVQQREMDTPREKAASGDCKEASPSQKF